MIYRACRVYIRNECRESANWSDDLHKKKGVGWGVRPNNSKFIDYSCCRIRIVGGDVFHPLHSLIFHPSFSGTSFFISVPVFRIFWFISVRVLSSVWFALHQIISPNVNIPVIFVFNPEICEFRGTSRNGLSSPASGQIGSDASHEHANRPEDDHIWGPRSRIAIDQSPDQITHSSSITSAIDLNRVKMSNSCSCQTHPEHDTLSAFPSFPA